MLKTAVYRLDMSVNLRLVLMDSGQLFHWRVADDLAAGDESPRPDSYIAVVENRAVMVRAVDGGLEITEYISEVESGDKPDTAKGRAFWSRYFDATRDYGALRDSCARFPRVREAMEALPGLRVLNQPPWEALIAFILSANNNVARIRRLVNDLGRELGKRYEAAGQAVYSFPEPLAIVGAGEARLRALGVGYRAPYLTDTARLVAEGFPLEELAAMPYDRAHARLLQLPGVGPKVADCVLLFGCGHASATPVDVWMERVLRGWFSLSGSKAQIKRQAMALLGDQAGVVQQYLFHAARTGVLDGRTDELTGG